MLANMKVLLVEDTDEDRGVLRLMLETLGHHVIEARDGKQAVQATIDQNPDVVLMDLAMPEVDGLEATAAIRAISRFEGRLPIIAMTAFQETLSEENARNAGCDDYLLKPIELQDLSAAFDRVGAPAKHVPEARLVELSKGTGLKTSAEEKSHLASCDGCTRRLGDLLRSEKRNS